jgi:hypothetical protein
MSRDLTVTDRDIPLLPWPKPDREVDDLLRFVHSGSYREGGGLRCFNMPSNADRQKLSARLDSLVKMTDEETAFNLGQTRLLVAQMLMGYRVRRAEIDGVRLGQDVELFVRELRLKPAVPTWAVQQVCMRTRMGTMKGISPSVEPTTGQLRSACDALIWGVKAEMGAISETLKAKRAIRAASEAERARISAGLQSLHRELAEREKEREGKEEAPPAFSKEQLQEMAGGGWDQLPDLPPMKSWNDVDQSTRAVRARMASGKLEKALAKSYREG